jgi:hypothetical protein
MNPALPAVPKPIPVDFTALEMRPALPEAPPPSPLRVVTLAPGSELEIAFVYKRTYDLDTAGGPPRVSDEQTPLAEEEALHEPLTPASSPSFKALPEVIAFKTGTDLVVRGTARPPRATREWLVWVRAGQHVHAARVFGRRVCERINGRLSFSRPEPFEALPLRMENAYGGRDNAYERSLMEEVNRLVTPETMRRARPSLGAIFAEHHPLMYPRNRFGKGYVLDAAAQGVEGRELPNLERPDDLLTPERLALPHPLDWTRQPLPAGFDYLDPFSFPRSAMLGFPPPSAAPLGDDIAEVLRGLIPAGYCLGNITARKPEEMGDCIHQWSSRCAQPGLCLPFFQGDEWVTLAGMDPALPEWQIPLPRERPEFTLPSWVRSGPVLIGDLHLVFIDVDGRRLSLIWSARTPLRTTLLPGQTAEVAAAGHLRLVGF